MDKRNLGMIADFYEFTMANGYFSKNMNDIAYFDVFFRRVPDEGGFAIFAGLKQVIDLIQNLSFTEDDINYLREVNSSFSEEFLNSHTLSEVQVSFKKPAVFGDKICLKSSQDVSQTHHQLFNETGEVEFARVRLSWK